MTSLCMQLLFSKEREVNSQVGHSRPIYSLPTKKVCEREREERASDGHHKGIEGRMLKRLVLILLVLHLLVPLCIRQVLYILTSVRVLRSKNAEKDDFDQLVEIYNRQVEGLQQHLPNSFSAYSERPKDEALIK